MQLTYVSGLDPGERLSSVTSYLEKISVCVCLYWSFTTFKFVVLYYMQLSFPVLIFSPWGLAEAEAHLNGGGGRWWSRSVGSMVSICYAKLPLGFLHTVGSKCYLDPLKSFLFS